MAGRKRVVSGMRPTGRLHIGHYFGALQNWVRLQNSVNEQGPDYDCFYFIADWHALTTDYASTGKIADNTYQVVMDWLAVGLDPQKCTMFVQSQVPEHAELHVLLSMVTPLGWLERVPTYKEQLEQIKYKDLHTYGFLGYPVLQGADIVMYGDPDVPLLVPVGEDQVSHVELTREIVRRFNGYYGFSIDERVFERGNRNALNRILSVISPRVPQIGPELEIDDNSRREWSEAIRLYSIAVGNENFLEKIGEDRRFFSADPKLQEPEVLLTQSQRVPGTDGRKMSKSYGNYIPLSDEVRPHLLLPHSGLQRIRADVRGMVTDPARTHRNIPGNPDVCPVFSWHKLFSPPEVLKWSAEGCRTAGIGCIECKAAMADHLIKWIAPIRERRQEYEKEPARVLAALDEGSKKARAVAQKTMERVREAVFGWEKRRGEIVSPAMKSAEARK